MDLLPLSYISVVLSDALQGQLLHQVYLIGLFQVLALEKNNYIFKQLAEKTLEYLGNQNTPGGLTMNFCTLMGKVAE